MAPGRALQHRVAAVDVAEDVVVRQYRYLLTTASVDALQGIHVEVMGSLSVADRARVLGALLDAFATGRHVDATETDKVAHLVAVGAHRAPLAWLDSLGRTFARRLAAGVLDTEASFGRFNGYAAWDGESPEPVEDPGPNDGFDPRGVGDASTARYRTRVNRDPRIYLYGATGV
ncbi:hypothetical protein [Pedococcus soli]